MFSRLIYLLIFGGIGYWFWYDPQVKHPPGVLVATEPAQVDVRKEKWTKGNYTVEALTSFKLGARVLRKEPYWFDAYAELSPFDLALGWQEMSDSRVLSKMKITQDARWYFFEWKEPAVMLTEEVNFKSSNMHIIPANKEVLDGLQKIIKGDVVEIEGYLVRVTGPAGFRWISSVVRTDTGGTACEVVWVEKLNIAPRPEGHQTLLP